MYYYLDSLGATAAANHSGFLRQDLTGAAYGLVEGCATAGKWETYNLKVSKSRTPPGTCRPNPDFFGAVLFRRLMAAGGERVMNVSATSGQLRAWGHCAAKASDLTLLLLNLENRTVSVDLSRAAADDSTRTDWVMTPGETPTNKDPSELLKSTIVELNGSPLRMGGGGDVMPSLEGTAVTGAAVATTLKLPPLAIAFAVVHSAKACGQ